ncbi:hypothetical protein ABZ930_30310 [Streptomyces sp. NPDC046716]|uniref:hypothetical protein n=1 Tax=Streptomyces sp. NPDC046716 TaxID=3157093 RepID=UPI003408610C
MRIDCSGLTADDVLSVVAERVDAKDDGTTTVDLENVPYAGPLITSAEPRRIAESVPLAVEREFGLKTRIVTAPAAPAPALPDVPGLAHKTVAQLASAAGALERPAVPLAVWRCLARAVLRTSRVNASSAPTPSVTGPAAVWNRPPCPPG